MSPKQGIRLGSFTILSGLGGTLVAGLLAWVFSTTLENKITFAPLTDSITTLTNNLKDAEKRLVNQDKLNRVEHKLIVNQLAEMTNRMSANEIRLETVIRDCTNNRLELKECEHRHNRK